MSRRDNAQLNIRSTFAPARAHEIARRTGMTANEVIEDALRAGRNIDCLETIIRRTG
jgi:hypothetical protein